MISKSHSKVCVRGVLSSCCEYLRRVCSPLTISELCAAGKEMDRSRRCVLHVSDLSSASDVLPT